eukprot:scaffold912_cov187-Ochromonas_danica.AAC.36
MAALVLQMLAPTSSNWLDLLRAADLLRLPALRARVVSFLENHFSSLLIAEKTDESDAEEEKELVEDFRSEFPDLYDQLLLHHFRQPAPPSDLLLHQVKESEMRASEATKPGLPILALVGILVSVLLFQQLGNVIAFGWMVPITNFVALVAFVYYVVYLS